MNSQQDNDFNLKYAELEKELAKKNRELEVEAALDRVRSVAMDMRKPGDLLDICKAMYEELQLLDFSDLRNAIIHTYLHANYLIDYDYSDFTQGHISHIPYSGNSIAEKYAKDIRKTKDAFAELIITGSKLKKWKAFMDANNEAPDERLINATSLFYYIYAVGDASIGISTFSPIRADKLDVLKRFRNVFDLAYRRFVDISKAEAQAREAKIEAALERVRSRSMGMQKSDELKEVIQIIYDQFVHLGIEIEHTGFVVDYELGGDWHFWTADHIGSPNKIKVANYDCAWNRSFDDAKVKGIDFFTTLLNFEEKNQFYRDLFAHAPGDMPEQAKQIIFDKPGLAVSTVLLDDVGLYIENFSGTPYTDDENATLMRFGKVFQQTYTRFLDLQKAEAQARESQIQLALERVRARTMAMQKSEELAIVIQAIYDQLVHLGLDVITAGFIMDYTKRADMGMWVASQGQPNAYEVNIPYYDGPIYNLFYEAIKKGIDFYPVVLNKEEKDIHYRHVFQHTRPVPNEVKEMVYSMPGYADSHVLLKDVVLFISNLTGIPYSDEENTILMRFGKVFEQTYTRFSDLKKAEEQARESQIQLTLERVRARSMAMQKSEELQEVIQVVFDQLQLLNFNLDVANFALNYKETDDFDLWIASAGAQYATRIYIPYFNHPIFDHFNKAKIQSGLFTDTLSYEEKNGFFEHFFKHSPEVSAERKAVVFDRPGLARSSAIMKNTVLSVINYEGIPYSDAENNVLLRFGQVFDQTYTRFSDLKQAEEQARESQIQLALERVRARTMAMQKSEELAETVFILFQQFKELGENPDQATIGIINEDEQVIEYWVTMHGEQTNRLFKFSIDEPNVTKKIYQGWKQQQKSIVIDLSGKALHDFTTYRAGMGGAPAKKDEKRRIINVAFFTKGLINVQSNEDRSEGSLRLLERFAGVFDGTYTRFLDLKQAEAQARESQIQLALERVRARTMAMQHSEELAETAGELFQQLHALGIIPERVFVGIPIDGTRKIDLWGTEQGGMEMTTRFEAEMDATHAFRQLFKALADKAPEAEVILKDKDLAEHINYVANVLDMPLRIELVQDQRVLYGTYFSKGWLVTVTPDILSRETLNILQRFAAVFDQTYTRFLDLQKAEAQARESQIQLGLERVRAAAMAMHDSKDVGNATALVFSELYKLGITTIRCGVCIIDGATQQMEVWSANSSEDGKVNRGAGKLDMNGHPLWLYLLDAWRQKTSYFSYELKGKELADYYRVIKSAPDYEAPQDAKPGNFPDTSQYCNCFLFNEGCLFTFTGAPFSPEISQVIEKFAIVFSLTYRRYLDLTKAEAQAREAKIEASLERIRSKTMAMHNSQDVADTVITMFDELVKLGLDPAVRSGIAIVDHSKRMELWTAFSKPDGTVTLDIGHLDVAAHPLTMHSYHGWANKESEVSYELIGDDVRSYFKALNDAPDYHVNRPLDNLPERWYNNCFFFPEGCLFVFGGEPLSAEIAQLFKRFAGVFGQTYRRYLDLQRAEAQAREAKIEASLERVRSKTMAMHNSGDVADTAALMFDELVKLGVEKTVRCGIGVLTRSNPQIEVWTAKAGENEKPELIIGHFDTNIHPLLKGLYDAWYKHEQSFSYLLAGDDKIKYYESINNQPDYPIKYDVDTLPSTQYNSDFFFAEGVLYVFTSEPLSDEISSAFKRFAGVFGQTYRRYLDLQRAEAQAREAQIEAALERVRSKAMAMRSSNDLNATANIVFVELRKLGVDLVRCGVGLMEKQVHVATIHAATSSAGGGSLEVLGKINMDIHPVCAGIYGHWEEHKDYFPILEGETLKTYYEALSETTVSVPEWKSDDKQYGYFLPFANGSLYAWSGKQESEATIKTLKRFSSVFGLTYTRYLELQKSEASAREAIRAASLDRVRGEIASMRTTADLQRITPLVWNELTILGIPFIRCGVFIINEDERLIHSYLSTPDGKALAAFDIAFDSEGIGQNVLPAWRKRQTATVHWSAEEFAGYTQNLVEQGSVKSEERYVTEHPDTSLDLHFLPFLQGMLYVGNIAPLGRDEMDLVGSLADAFSTAYARYEDFNKLELAKQQVENTLSDLKATQTKLIQSEKMASLGELTAGIAHEIQNPLNFVNNFSEVNQEMIDELEEELTAGNIENALAIAADLKQNEAKISHHGKRADGIVKGMLQHSRTGGGEKEPTNMNALADEFLRLSYHGLRAKDKVFNAEMVTHFDPDLPKINVIPQNMGRVMLNLFNNAFYAVNQKKKTADADYKPEVIVTTSTGNGQIIINVRDNGVGMPENIKEKIMQPFFTTKPTGEGTGLGLSLTYDMVVKGHGGAISVETKEGEFTEFTISLPIH